MQFRLHHVNYLSSNQDAIASMFQRALLQISVQQSNGANFVGKGTDFSLEWHSPTLESHYDKSSGIHHLAFAVDNVEGVCHWLGGWSCARICIGERPFC